MAQIAAAPTTSRNADRRPARRRAPGRAGWGALLVSAGARTALALLAGLLLWTVAPATAGWSSSVVMSNSMAPRLLAGDVVLVRPLPPAELRPGQVLLVDDPDRPGRLRLHRLTAIDAATGALTLKGDANARADSTTVGTDAVHGVAALRVPWVGSPALWLAEGRLRPLAATATALAALVAGIACYRPLAAAGRAPRHRAPASGRAPGPAPGPRREGAGLHAFASGDAVPQRRPAGAQRTDTRPLPDLDGVRPPPAGGPQADTGPVLWVPH